MIYEVGFWGVLIGVDFMDALKSLASMLCRVGRLELECFGGVLAAGKDSASVGSRLENEDSPPTRKAVRLWAPAKVDSSPCATNTAKPLELGRGLSGHERAAPVWQASTGLGATES